MTTIKAYYEERALKEAVVNEAVVNEAIGRLRLIRLDWSFRLCRPRARVSAYLRTYETQHSLKEPAGLARARQCRGYPRTYATQSLERGSEGSGRAAPRERTVPSVPI